MDANNGEADKDAKVGDLPPDPKVLAKSLIRLLRDVPWVGLGGLGTGAGAALLYFYFRSIDFVPADIPAILGASLFVAMLGVAFILYVVVALIAPVWAYQTSVLHVRATERPARRTEWMTLPALQALAAGLLVIYVGMRLQLGCEPSAAGFLWSGVALAVGSAVVVWRIEAAKDGEKPAGVKRLIAAAWVCASSVFPVGALMALYWPEQGQSWWHLGAIAGVWLICVGASACLRHVPLWACALVTLLSLPLFAVSIPAMFGSAFLFPTHVAEMAGVRAKHSTELRLPDATCHLIKSALATGHARHPLFCSETGWSVAHAHVLSTLGARWLIELKTLGPDGGQTSLRLTIPGEGVQTVRRTTLPKPTACRT